MKVAIFGCGYIGSSVAKLWKENGHQVTVTTTTPEKVDKLSFFSDRVSIVTGNDINAIEELIKDREILLLSVGAKGRDTYRSSYLETAQNLVTALKNNTTIKQIIYTGSYGILGDKNGEWVDEETPVTPVNEKGEILAETERVLLSAQSPNLKICILRLAGIYGEGRELIKIFKTWSGTTRSGKGDDYSNWIHKDDIVRSIELARAKQLQGIYHLSCDETLNTKEFFTRLFTKHNLPNLNWDENKKSTRPYNTRLSNKKIKDAGLKFIYPQIQF